jgi:WD40 repeat protein
LSAACASAAAGASGELAIVDATTGIPVTVLDGPSQQLRVACFDPSSRRVAAASWDGTARVWDARSPYRSWHAAPISTGYGLFGGVVPDGRFLAVTCPGCITRVWDTAGDRLLAALPEVVASGDDAAVPFPAVSAAGDRAALARGKAAELYELPGGKLLRSVSHGAAVTAVTFGANGELVSGDAAGAVLVTRPGEEPFALPSSGAGIDALVTLPNGRIAAADAGGRVRVFDHGVVTAELNAEIRARTLRPSPDGQRLLVVPSHVARPALPVLFDHERGTAKLDAPQAYTARWVDGGRAILTTHSDGAARIA